MLAEYDARLLKLQEQGTHFRKLGQYNAENRVRNEITGLVQARAAVAELMGQRAELIARLEQVVPYLYVLENEGIDTCVPVRMKIEQAEAALARCKGEGS